MYCILFLQVNPNYYFFLLLLLFFSRFLCVLEARSMKYEFKKLVFDPISKLNRLTYVKSGAISLWAHTVGVYISQSFTIDSTLINLTLLYFQ
jgi:hypothetical protein